MVELIKSFQDMIISRVKNMVFMNFIFAWCIWNYETVLILLFKKQEIEIKINLIKEIPIDFFIIYPSILAFIYIFFFPMVNLGVNIAYEGFVGKNIKRHSNNTLVNHYNSSI